MVLEYKKEIPMDKNQKVLPAATITNNITSKNSCIMLNLPNIYNKNIVKLAIIKLLITFFLSIINSPLLWLVYPQNN